MLRKSLAYLLSFLIAVCLLAGCAGKKGIMDLEETEQLVAGGVSEEELSELLKGYSRDEIISEWGTADIMLSGMYGEGWYLEDCKKELILYYDDESSVMWVKLSESWNREKETVQWNETADVPLNATSEEFDVLLPFDETTEFMFASGAGAWGTMLYLEKDGSFTGSFHDSNMGETGEGYPGGTCYLCSFSGRFTDIRKLDDNSYEMTLSEIVTDKQVGEEWIEDGVLYVASTPYGLESGEEIILYSPETKVSGLSEDFLSWWPERFNMDGAPETLNSWGIYNVEAGYGFFTY